MEVPDIAAWVKPHELLLTTGYALRQEPDTWAQLIADLADAGPAGVGFKVGRYVDTPPTDMLEEADRLGLPVIELPVIELPVEVAFDDVISQVLETVLDDDRSLLTRSDEALRSLLEIVLAGGDLQLLYEGLARLLGVAVLLTAVGGDVVVEAGDGELVRRARELPCFGTDGHFHAAQVALPDHSHRVARGSVHRRSPAPAADPPGPPGAGHARGLKARATGPGELNRSATNAPPREPEPPALRRRRSPARGLAPRARPRPARVGRWPAARAAVRPPGPPPCRRH